MPAAQMPAKLSVDFSNVSDRKEGGGKAAHVPEGDYLLQVLGCELRKKKEDESKYLSWRLGIVKPSKYAHAGVVYFVTSLKEEALWNLRNFLEDLGYSIPKKAVDVPIAKIVEGKKLIGATLQDDEYNEKVKSKVAATFKASAYEETAEAPAATEADDEEETAAAATTSSSDDDDEELEEIDVDDI